MSKFPVGEQVESVGHESDAVVAVFPAVDGTIGYAVDTIGNLLAENPGFIFARRGSA